MPSHETRYRRDDLKQLCDSEIVEIITEAMPNDFCGAPPFPLSLNPRNEESVLSLATIANSLGYSTCIMLKW
jgi:hypothetical protein